MTMTRKIRLRCLIPCGQLIAVRVRRVDSSRRAVVTCPSCGYRLRFEVPSWPRPEKKGGPEPDDDIDWTALADLFAKVKR